MNYFKQESQRLKYRKLTKEDIESWTEFFIQNDHLKFLGIDLNLKPETQATNWIENQLKRYANVGLGHLAIEIKSTNEFIGVGGIIPREIDGQKEYEVAYSIIPRFWKKGYGTEIAIQMKEFGFENIETNRFISIIAKENVNSIRVAEKNQMKIISDTQYLGMEVFIFGIENR